MKNCLLYSRLTSAAAAVSVALPGLACAQSPATEPAKAHPALVELFLSQACNMCPPAAALFPEIAARDDVVALAWHIDYWNMTDSEHGRWKDPYSQASFTKRQKLYNLNIRHRSSIYTPQIVVNGVLQTVGGHREKIRVLINESKRSAASLTVSYDEGEYNFSLGANANGGNAYLITFKHTVTTRITGGENAGKVFDEVNVVTDMRPLGLVRRTGAELSAPAPAAGEGCALIVQEPKQKRIVAAAYCQD
ncbi:DUF1223 domain-containing protein [Hyphococcus sp.]|uniref:DUF1223 domain-containing protein n=1 Tax=Hyphococcus sp. TaxID=2038636 RepID=UPI002080D0A1|nr:MAG: hypothetical protein DHS20C04_08220 [Marinicaulis sp.]